MLSYRTLAVCFVLAVYRLESCNAVKITGRVLCRLKNEIFPIQFSKITLLDKDKLCIDEVMGSSTTDMDGNFEVQGTAANWAEHLPDPYVRLDYYHKSEKAELEIVNSPISIDLDIASWLSFGRTNENIKPTTSSDYDTSPVYKDQSGELDMGELVFESEQCQTYVTYYAAAIDFYDRTGTAAPYGKLRLLVPAPIHNGLPFTPYCMVWIAPGSAYKTFRTAQHEFAHTVRHWLDAKSNIFHWIWDALYFWYARFHTCTGVTNPGFAFNEGWAEYWAGSCGSDALNSTISGPMNVEGNVARGLRYLQETCQASDADMVRVLAESPKQIHSFDDYRKQFEQLLNCPIGCNDGDCTTPPKPDNSQYLRH